MATDFTVVDVDEGRTVTHHGFHSYTKPKQVKVNRRWEVRVDDKVIGEVEYRMETHENRTPGRVYVNYRWESPAYFYSTREDSHRYRGQSIQLRGWSHKECVAIILREYERKTNAN